jgi:predicted phosphate transport protein (TIGR00153 family)
LVSAKWLSWLKGNDKKIIEMLEQQSINLVNATESLVKIISVDKGERINEAKILQIKELEHKGDNITHSLFTILIQTFVTPLDREDIASLASAIDEVLDYTDGIADRFLLFNIEKPTVYMIDLSKILFSSTQEILFVVNILHKIKNTSELITRCSNIKKCEQEADKVYRKAIADLFETNNNAIEIIKLKEIYENFESALDKCQDVSDIIEDIALKYG